MCHGHEPYCDYNPNRSATIPPGSHVAQGRTTTTAGEGVQEEENWDHYLSACASPQHVIYVLAKTPPLFVAPESDKPPLPIRCVSVRGLEVGEDLSASVLVWCSPAS